MDWNGICAGEVDSVDLCMTGTKQQEEIASKKRNKTKGVFVSGGFEQSIASYEMQQIRRKHFCLLLTG